MLAGAKLIAAEMRREVGHYQDAEGDLPAWRKLAASTLAKKRAKGQAPPDNPLEASGAMRDAIGGSAADDGMKAAAGAKESPTHDGSLGPVALWDEKGTRGPHAGGDGYHVPPRSFVARSAYRRGPEATKLIGKRIIEAIAGVRIDD